MWTDNLENCLERQWDFGRYSSAKGYNTSDLQVMLGHSSEIEV